MYAGLEIHFLQWERIPPLYLAHGEGVNFCHKQGSVVEVCKYAYDLCKLQNVFSKSLSSFGICAEH